MSRPRCGRSLLPGRTGWVLRNGRRRIITRPTTTERGHYLPVQPPGRTPRRQPAQDAPVGGLVSTCSSRAPQPTDRHPGAGPAPLSARRQPVRVRCGGLRSVVDLLRATHGHRSAIPSLQAHAGRRPRRPRTTAARRSHCAQRDGPPHRAIPGPARCGQRGCRAADTGGPSVRTPGWHRSRGHRTRGHRTSARPIGRTSARRTEDADRATTGVAGVRTSLATGDHSLGRPDLARVAGSGRLATHNGRGDDT